MPATVYPRNWSREANRSCFGELGFGAVGSGFDIRVGQFEVFTSGIPNSNENFSAFANKPELPAKFPL